jgi:hypothetical protein
VTLPFVLCATVTVVSALVSLGFSLASTRTPVQAQRSLGLYASARSFALLLASVAAFWAGSVPWLQMAAGCLIVVQACDAAIGATIGDRMKTLGPLATAIFNLVALVWALA